MAEHRWTDVRGWGGALPGTLQCDYCNRVASPTDPKRLASDWLATQIAAAEQRGREDNADHGQCYVFGSKALAAVRAEAWDEGHRDVCNDCCCRPGINPYRDGGA